MYAIGANMPMGAPSTVRGPSTVGQLLPMPAAPSFAGALGLTDTQAKLLDAPVEIGVVEGSVSEADRTIDVRRELDSLETPVDETKSARLADRISDLRSLARDPKLSAAARMYVEHKIRGLENLEQLVRRQEKQQLLIKELLRKLAQGALTPDLVRQAKALGLVRVLKEAITELVKRGALTPQDCAALSALLAGEGIQMPVLDDLVIRSQRSASADVEASKSARGETVDPTVGVSDAGTGAALLSGTRAPRPAR